MGKISVLPPALASQIAAGEVVERPASALKELIENALDAGASRCDVEISAGGIERLCVRDDGSGMSPEDAALSIERHATSKLTSFEELSDVPSFGFRGEALPSISSVSRFSLQTRDDEHEAGTRVEVHGGSPPEITDVGMAVGTHIEVRELFYNVPARRKFLRSTGTEAGHIADVVDNAALACPEVTFTLQRDGRTAREWLRAPDRASRVLDMFTQEELTPCVGERGPLLVEAFLGRPERARSGAAGLKLFCNQRPIRDRAILHAIAQAYGSILERGRYPRGVVYLNLPPQLVDTNVHPQKSEVRFADHRAVTDALYLLLSSQLNSAFSLPPGGGRWTEGVSASTEREIQSPAQRGASDTNRATNGRHATRSAATVSRAQTTEASPVNHNDHKAWPPQQLPDISPDISPGRAGFPAAPLQEAVDVLSKERIAARKQAAENEQASENGQRPTTAELDARTTLPSPSSDLHRAQRFQAHAYPRSETQPHQQAISFTGEASRETQNTDQQVSWRGLRFVAQVRSTYLICEGQDGLYVLDQHAAAERVTFDKLRKQFHERGAASQSLLFPLTLEVGAAAVELAATREKEIRRLGFEINPLGETTVSVRTIPKLLQTEHPERLVRELLLELSRDGRELSGAIDAALSTMACHSSIRAGNKLERGEADALLTALDNVDFSTYCPHGRPIVAFTPWNELERKVGRR